MTYSLSVTPEQKSELESKEQDGVEKSVFVAEKSMDLVGSGKDKIRQPYHCRSGFGYDAVCQFAYGKRSTDHIPEGEAVISAKVADELGIKTGDTRDAKHSDMKTISVTVSGL